MKTIKRKTKERNKLLIIGLDGATPNLINKWIDELPNLKEIKRNGIFGNLKSTIPPFSCPAWNCFMTGKNPGKIGIFDFQVGLSQFDVTSYPLIVNLTYQDSLTFWDILSKANFKVGIINVPLTYPPEEINGFIPSPEQENYIIVQGSAYDRQVESLSVKAQSGTCQFDLEIDYSFIDGCAEKFITTDLTEVDFIYLSHIGSNIQQESIY